MGDEVRKFWWREEGSVFFPSTVVYRSPGGRKLDLSLRGKSNDRPLFVCLFFSCCCCCFFWEIEYPYVDESIRNMERVSLKPKCLRIKSVVRVYPESSSTTWGKRPVPLHPHVSTAQVPVSTVPRLFLVSYPQTRNVSPSPTNTSWTRHTP